MLEGLEEGRARCRQRNKGFRSKDANPLASL